MANLQLIRRLCDEKKLTIRELASRIGIGDIAIHKMIGKGSTNISTLESIAHELGVSAGVFFGDEEKSSGGITVMGSSVTGSALGHHAHINACPEELLKARAEISAMTERIKNMEREIAYLQEIIKEKEKVITLMEAGKKKEMINK